MSAGVALGAMVTSLVLIRYSRLLLITSADKAQDRDARPPILFLRAFHDDQVRFRLSNVSWLSWLLDLIPPRSNLDQEIFAEGVHFGPVVALGNPADAVPPYGAARGYFEPSNWQSAVKDLLERAGAVILCIDDTDSVWWEVEQIIEGGHLNKTLFFYPSRAAEPGLNSSLHQKLIERMQERNIDCAGLTAQRVATGRQVGVLGFFVDADGHCNLTWSRSFSRLAYLSLLRLYCRKKLNDGRTVGRSSWFWPATALGAAALALSLQSEVTRTNNLQSATFATVNQVFATKQGGGASANTVGALPMVRVVDHLTESKEFALSLLILRRMESAARAQLAGADLATDDAAPLSQLADALEVLYFVKRKMSLVFGSSGDLSGEIATMKELILLGDKINHVRPDPTKHDLRRGSNMMLLALRLVEGRRYSEAVDLILGSMRIFAQRVRAEPKRVSWVYRLFVSKTMLARARGLMGEGAASNRIYTEATELVDDIANLSDSDLAMMSGVAQAMGEWGKQLEAANMPEMALAAYRRGLAALERVPGSEHDKEEYRQLVEALRADESRVQSRLAFPNKGQ